MTANETLFLDEYSRLNTAQKKAVDAVEGPVMVIAGPGTGKTQILTLRIANILRQTDTSPDAILALTFTDSATINMRKRLSRIIGARAYEVKICTFHGFANGIIGEYPEYFPSIIGSKPVSELEQLEIIKDIIVNTKLEWVKPLGDQFHYVRDLISAIGELKKENISPEKYTEIIALVQKSHEEDPEKYHTKGAYKGKIKADHKKRSDIISKNIEVALVYMVYEQKMREIKRFDFNDMLREVNDALDAEEGLLYELQEKYHYILVDEHQDTNNVQNTIVEKILSYHDNPNIFSVGDDKQAIYRFQGASLKNFFYFKKKYPKAIEITLTDNYRSNQPILNSVHGFFPTKTPLTAKGAGGHGAVSIIEFPNAMSEEVGVARRIAKHMGDGVPPHEIAILYRKNTTAERFSRALASQGIPFRVESNADLWSHPVARGIRRLVGLLANPIEEKILYETVLMPCVGGDSYNKVTLLRSIDRKTKKGLIETILDPAEMNKYGETGLEVSNWLKKLLILAEDATVELPTKIVERMLHELGVLGWVLSSESPNEWLQVVGVLFDIVKEYTENSQNPTMSGLNTSLQILSEENTKVRLAGERGREGFVRLMTAHGSKGLEFDVVYVVNVTDKDWSAKAKSAKIRLLEQIYDRVDGLPDMAESEESETLEGDIRRLLYVAMTRAKSELILTYGARASDGREQLKSSLLAEIKDELYEKIEGEEYDELEYLFPKALQGKDADRKQKILEFVAETFEHTALSVSALNNYITDPWNYFFKNLIRIPSDQSRSQVFGTAVHAALSMFYKRHYKDEPVDEQTLHDEYQIALDKVLLTDIERDEALEKGTRALHAWYEKNKSSIRKSLSEQAIPEFELFPGVKITGNIDRIEFRENDRVVVVDYKTGKPKSRNHLIGNTNSSDGAYYRQLVFYKLLLNHWKGGRYKMEHGIIDFVEPDESGKLRDEVFEIPDEEVASLTERIEQVAFEIKNLLFWDKEPTDECAYQDLVRVIRGY